jgi:hypothetical protein
MARPTKHNADYFSHDNSMRNDIKIKSLRRKHGHTGYSIWNMLIELLTSQEYFEYEWNEFNVEMLSADFDIDTDELQTIVDYCIKLGLLQNTSNYLHCDKLTFRLEEDVLKRRTNYCNNNSKRNQLKGVNVNNNYFNDTIMNTITPLQPINVDINTQSKVKEIKENKSKVNQSEVKKSVEKIVIDDDYFDSVFSKYKDPLPDLRRTIEED